MTTDLFQLVAAQKGCNKALSLRDKSPVVDGYISTVGALVNQCYHEHFVEAGGRNAGGLWREHIEDSKEIWKRPK